MVSSIDSASSPRCAYLGALLSGPAHAVISLNLSDPKAPIPTEESSSRPRLTTYTNQPQLLKANDSCFPALLNSWDQPAPSVLLFSALARGRSFVGVL
jgi:hypothetical protein